jgi:glycosyltransferase involved in cell wall biosynthesis
MISVCIPTYNGEKFIRQQLDSIISQLGKEDELIISDDSSTDNTTGIIRSYNDDRIQLLENSKFRSPIFNLENALKRAKGDYIFLSDQDDVWSPDKIKITVDKLKYFDIVVCNGYIIDGKGKIVHESYFDWKGSGPGFLRNFIKNSYIGCALAFNRKILNFALPFPPKIAMHDIWIGLLAECTGKTLFIEERLFYYRRHFENYTASISKIDSKLSDFSLTYKIKYRMILLFYLTIRIFKSRKLFYE